MNGVNNLSSMYDEKNREGESQSPISQSANRVKTGVNYPLPGIFLVLKA